MLRTAHTSPRNLRVSCWRAPRVPKPSPAVYPRCWRCWPSRPSLRPNSSASVHRREIDKGHQIGGHPGPGGSASPTRDYSGLRRCKTRGPFYWVRKRESKFSTMILSGAEPLTLALAVARTTARTGHGHRSAGGPARIRAERPWNVWRTTAATALPRKGRGLA